jgi:hypothetical protein
MGERDGLKDSDSTTGAILVPIKHPKDYAVIRLLEQVLDDARRGGTTTIAMVIVNCNGIVQTPCQGGQIREIALGLEKLQKDIHDSYSQAVACVGKYQSMR